MKKRRIFIIISIFFIFLSALLLTTVNYVSSFYGEIPFEQILHNLELNKSSSGTFFMIIKQNLMYFVLFLIIIITPLLIPNSKTMNAVVITKIKTQKKHIIDLSLLKLLKRNFLKYTLLVFIISSLYAFHNLSIMDYIKTNLEDSTFFEEHYVDPRGVEIIFPETKRNLIFIHLESMENTFMTTKNGGAWKYSLIPELEKLAENNLNFSSDEKVGGFPNTYGATWTVAALVAQSAGIPLKVPITDGNEVGNYSDFLPGSYSLGDILNKEGYNQTFLLGSDSAYGGRKNFFEEHGNYKIVDYNTALENNWIEEDYYTWWGYEDSKLFEYAKKELKLLAKDKTKPFNFTMLTADTHFIDGYLDKGCKKHYKNQYENVFRCSSKMLDDFISWIKKQDFYKNTTIVITGDHLTMQNSFVENINEEYTRTVYNSFINTKVKNNNNKNRKFNAYDIYPTILGSLGVEITGDKLALGTNLFSSTQTLSETYGVEFINEALSYRSNHYNKTIHKGVYFEMLSDAQNYD